MSKYLQLHIPQGCQENWNEMLPEEQGRFCLSCQKKVIDFTTFTDGELVQFFQNSAQPLCGRFAASQLDRQVRIPRKPMPWIRHFIHFTLPAFLLTLKATAQQVRVVAKTEQTPAAKRETGVLLSVPATVSVEGVIQDEQGNAIPAATILLKGTNRGVASDSEGRFSFKDIAAPATLVVSSVGFLSQELEVRPGQRSVQVRMQLGGVLMGEVVVVGYVVAAKTKKKKEKTSVLPQEDKQRLLVYPNPLPTGTALRLQCQKMEKGAYILEIYNVSGVQVHTEKLVYDKGADYLAVQVPRLLPGNYFLQLTHEQKGTRYREQVVITL